MVRLLIGLRRWLRGCAPAAVSVTPEPPLAHETPEWTVQIELLEGRDHPGVVWGT